MKLLLLILITILSTLFSCEKENKNCDCGYIVETRDSSMFVDKKLFTPLKILILKNCCSGDTTKKVLTTDVYLEMVSKNFTKNTHMGGYFNNSYYSIKYCD